MKKSMIKAMNVNDETIESVINNRLPVSKDDKVETTSDSNIRPTANNANAPL